MNGHLMTSDTTDTPLKSTVEILRDRVVRQTYGAGYRLKERDIAEELGVSRAVVRDALSILAERRLIVRHANRGAEVATLGAQEIIEIYEAREAVEGLIAHLAATRAPAGAWDELKVLFDEPIQKSVAEGDLDTYAAYLDQFQAAMIAHAQNQVLSEFTNSLSDRIAVLARRSIFLPGRAQQGLVVHRAVLHALDERRADDAQTLKRQNLRDARNSLLKYANYVR